MSRTLCRVQSDNSHRNGKVGGKYRACHGSIKTERRSCPKIWLTFEYMLLPETRLCIPSHDGTEFIYLYAVTIITKTYVKLKFLSHLKSVSLICWQSRRTRVCETSATVYPVQCIHYIYISICSIFQQSNIQMQAYSLCSYFFWNPTYKTECQKPFNIRRSFKCAEGTIPYKINVDDRYRSDLLSAH
jgi:hypothetical protein